MKNLVIEKRTIAKLNEKRNNRDGKSCPVGSYGTARPIPLPPKPIKRQW
jgi:hypothetical protein